MFVYVGMRAHGMCAYCMHVYMCVEQRGHLQLAVVVDTINLVF